MLNCDKKDNKHYFSETWKSSSNKTKINNNYTEKINFLYYLMNKRLCYSTLKFIVLNILMWNENI